MKKIVTTGVIVFVSIFTLKSQDKEFKIFLSYFSDYNQTVVFGSGVKNIYKSNKLSNELSLKYILNGNKSKLKLEVYRQDGDVSEEKPPKKEIIEAYRGALFKFKRGSYYIVSTEEEVLIEDEYESNYEFYLISYNGKGVKVDSLLIKNVDKFYDQDYYIKTFIDLKNNNIVLFKYNVKKPDTKTIDELVNLIKNKTRKEIEEYYYNIIEVVEENYKIGDKGKFILVKKKSPIYMGREWSDIGINEDPLNKYIKE